MVRIIYNRLNIASEHPLTIRTNGRLYYYGFLDIFFRAVVNVEVGWGIEPTYILREDPWIFSGFIEVKSKADSLGKILRELNFYREFFFNPQECFKLECDGIIYYVERWKIFYHEKREFFIPCIGFVCSISKNIREIFRNNGYAVLTVDMFKGG